MNVDSKDKLILAADQVLYRAKREGKNRVIVAMTEIKNSEKPK